jgi:hypothetical protein
MADDGEQQIRTATDLALEELIQRMDSMEATYKTRIAELEEANRGLWAAAHPAPALSPDPAPEAPAWDTDKAVDAFRTALGAKE